MRHLPLFAASILALETAALACSCIATDDPAELQRIALDVSEDAVALVEVEALTSYQQTRAGEQMKVVRTIAGSAPAQFRIERGPHTPSSASCDILYEPGQRDVVILYPPRPDGGAGNAMPTYRTSGLCMDHLLDKPVFRDAVVKTIGSGTVVSVGERG